MCPSSPLSSVPEGHTAAAIDYDVGDQVDVLLGSEMYGRSWQPATVVKVLAEHRRCVVEYDFEDAVRDMVDWADIRHRPPAPEAEEETDDGGGEDEERPAPAGRGGGFFKAGDRVELLRCHPDYGDAWYPATVEGLVDPESETYAVHKVRAAGGRPCPDDEETEYQELGLENFRPAAAESGWLLDLSPGAAVEARCDGVWAIGAVLEAVGELHYRVAIGKEIKVIKDVRSLRPRYKWDWKNREWSLVTSFRKSASVKRPRSPIEKASSDGHSYDSETFATKKSGKQWKQLNAMPGGSESALVSNMDNVSGKTPRVLTKKVTTRRNKLKFHMKKGHKEQCNPHSSLDATAIQLSTMGTHGCLLDEGEGLTTTINSGCEANQNEDGVSDPLPFIKSLPAWSKFEKMEVFKKMPQRPHFGPLTNQSPALREGTALAMMGSFASVVESISKSSIEDSDESFQEKEYMLSMLKHFGFSVEKLQACLNKLIVMKSEYAKHIKEKDVVQVQKQLKGDSCSKVDSLRAENMKMLLQLFQGLQQVLLESQQLNELKEREDAELLELKEVESMVDKACYDIKEQFVHTLADHLG